MKDTRLIEISSEEFKTAVEREFPLNGFGDATTFYWDFADMHYVAVESPKVRIQTWCGKRENEVWTSVQLHDIRRSLGLDTLAALHGDDSYPPSMSGSWTAGEFRERIRLEGALIRRHLASMELTDLVESEGGGAEPDAVSLDDPIVHFVRRCAEYFDPLGEEFGLVREYDQMGSGLLYRGEPNSLRVCLLETSSEKEDEPGWSVVAEVIESPGNVVPPLFFGGEELEVAEREGPFSLGYLERSLSDAATKARADLMRRRSDG